MPLNSTRGAGSAKAFGFTVKGGASGPVEVDYLVVAGGGPSKRGGGGAGGYRTSFPGGTKITLDLGSTPITVGGAGTPSIFSTITSTAGGAGAIGFPTGPYAGNPGGSGGGGSCCNPGAAGTGNTPPVSPPQGNDGGTRGATYKAGGGGGAAAAGSPGNPVGNGGAGSENLISGSPVFYAGGGGGNGFISPIASVGGVGGGGGRGSPGTDGTGGGAGGAFPAPAGATQSGGAGIVILRTPGANGPRISVSPGTNTKTTAPNGDTVATFTVSGSITI